ncbi:LOW QUALITY PROTEIN: putative F-box protein At4g17200 [Arabidopsis lyrata subsp. lyrata]|uniref:LOW QUALITY PROTEIN: putative F-box protein At4g17200 n=1 Tax=Arabidopsis lyrata subsp. lyrata TaxID=81972 RepID=UPI000A29C59B|nr:LOW QUALITY PROTEIN: putative F-box protein At4g17200 [Arabidopsis lyrata subsp. lyrata]|eukprot:XP_020885911.1 LOW QUALITY PROTEIN: putative F-box protein At4g17200 [Arabidopsis lyrata subsp. lyrata]
MATSLSKNTFSIGFEIYHHSSNSWRVVDVTPDWNVEFYQRGVSLKGNTYFYAQEKLIMEGEGLDDVETTHLPVFLLCFDFTAERFGPRLPLPFHSHDEEIVSLSCVKEEQLAVLYQNYAICLDIWITTMIEPTALSWSKFLKVDMRPLTGFKLYAEAGSFFIDDEKKVAVVFDLDGYKKTETCRYQTAHIIGQYGYFKSVNIREAPNLGKPDRFGFTLSIYCVPLVCSSYVPSLVKID